jgi:hypothetical protein
MVLKISRGGATMRASFTTKKETPLLLGGAGSFKREPVAVPPALSVYAYYAQVSN